MKSEIINQMETFSTARIVFVLGLVKLDFCIKFPKVPTSFHFWSGILTKGKYIALQSFYLNNSPNSNVTVEYCEGIYLTLECHTSNVKLYISNVFHSREKKKKMFDNW